MIDLNIFILYGIHILDYLLSLFFVSAVISTIIAIHTYDNYRNYTDPDNVTINSKINSIDNNVRLLYDLMQSVFNNKIFSILKNSNKNDYVDMNISEDLYKDISDFSNTVHRISDITKNTERYLIELTEVTKYMKKDIHVHIFSLVVSILLWLLVIFVPNSNQAYKMYILSYNNIIDPNKLEEHLKNVDDTITQYGTINESFNIKKTKKD